MAPRRLSAVDPDAANHITLNLWADPDDRPYLSTLGMRVVNQWSKVDFRLQRLLIQFLKADHAVILRFVNRIHSGHIKRTLLNLAADFALDKQALATFAATMKQVNRLREERNKYAHWIWASSRLLPDAILLIDPADLSKQYIALYDRLRQLDTKRMELERHLALASEGIDPGESSPEIHHNVSLYAFDANTVWVYEAMDIWHDITTAILAEIAVVSLADHLRDPADAEARDRLSESRQSLREQLRASS